ncbi:unnamed protein product [Trifolium pratense]|uniref:Uncharacterized protein n=1 Tax=Trifolium pratense TaxID=57577 RepID=A0ACB0J049_TRIPR|nr:unnamed protein product [Trifolium pratense]
MFHLLLNPTRDSSTYGFPSFHSLSTKPQDPLTFEIAISTDPNSTRQLILNQELGEYITSYHDYLLLEGPVAELMLSPIIKSVGQDQVTIYEVDDWPNFCRKNCFTNGDVVKFTFFDIENSNRVDVDWVSH